MSVRLCERGGEKTSFYLDIHPNISHFVAKHSEPVGERVEVNRARPPAQAAFRDNGDLVLMPQAHRREEGERSFESIRVAGARRGC